MKMKSLILFLLLFIFPNCHSPYKRAHPEPIQKKSLGAIRGLFHYEKGEAPKVSAHRGGTYPGYPENCLETMQRVARYGVSCFEIDIRETVDGKLVLLHDSRVDRTTTGTGLLEKKTYSELEKLRLRGLNGKPTHFKIPLFSTVLQWAKAHDFILMLDRKKPVLWRAIVGAVESQNAENQCVIITYNAEEAQRVHHTYPHLFLSVPMRNEQEFRWMMESGIPHGLMLAFTGTRLSPTSLYGKIHDQGIPTQLGTLGNLDKSAAARGDAIYEKYIRDGIDILATDRPIEVARALGISS